MCIKIENIGRKNYILCEYWYSCVNRMRLHCEVFVETWITLCMRNASGIQTKCLYRWILEVASVKYVWQVVGCCDTKEFHTILLHKLLFRLVSASLASFCLYSSIWFSCSPSQHWSRRAGQRAMWSVIVVLLVNLATTKHGVQYTLFFIRTHL